MFPGPCNTARMLFHGPTNYKLFASRQTLHLFREEIGVTSYYQHRAKTERAPEPSKTASLTKPLQSLKTLQAQSGIFEGLKRLPQKKTYNLQKMSQHLAYHGDCYNKPFMRRALTSHNWPLTADEIDSHAQRYVGHPRAIATLQQDFKFFLSCLETSDSTSQSQRGSCRQFPEALQECWGRYQLLRQAS